MPYIPTCSPDSWQGRGTRGLRLGAAWCSWAPGVFEEVRGVSGQPVSLRCRARPCAARRQRPQHPAGGTTTNVSLAAVSHHGRGRGLRSSRGASPPHVLARGRLGEVPQTQGVIVRWGRTSRCWLCSLPFCICHPGFGPPGASALPWPLFAGPAVTCASAFVCSGVAALAGSEGGSAS